MVQFEMAMRGFILASYTAVDDRKKRDLQVADQKTTSWYTLFVL